MVDTFQGSGSRMVLFVLALPGLAEGELDNNSFLSKSSVLVVRGDSDSSSKLWKIE